MIDIWKQSLYGLIILAVLSLVNLILIRKKTFPVIFLDHLFFTFIVYKFFKWPCLIYSFLLLAFIAFIRYKNHTSEKADFDYTGRILSVSAVPNVLHKPKEMCMGTILPINHNEIKHNMRKIELDDTILSGGTLITGSSGSGKNLYKDTLIPTVTGMKTIKDIEIGDIIFDKNGKQTKVIDKYSPKENKFYEFTFSDGTKIKSGAGHLWEVEQLYSFKKRGNIQTDFSSIDLEKLNNTNNNIITKQDFIIKYLDVNNYSLWDVFLTNNCKQFFQRFSNDVRYIDSNILLETAIKTNFKNHNKHRIKRIKDFQQQTKQIYMSNNEAQEILKSHWYEILIESNITKIDRLNSYCNEQELGMFLYKCFTYIQNYKHGVPNIAIMSSDEIAKIGIRNQTNIRHSLNFSILRPEECQYNIVELPIKPYWLGAWLGDGISDRQVICGVDEEIITRLNNDYKMESVSTETNRVSKLKYWRFDKNVRALLKHNNLLQNKHIPNIYKIASNQDKLELIAGLIDTDGYISKNGYCEISMTNQQIIQSLREICCSLGFDCSKIHIKQGKYKKNNKTVLCKMVYTFSFYPKYMLPLQVLRKRVNLQNGISKRNNLTQQIKHNRFYITDIQQINGKSSDYYCLAVDSPTHMFLCSESYIPTHNTTTIKTIMKQRILDQRPVVFFDYKGEEEILDEIKQYCQEVGTPYYEFSSRACTFTYDPFQYLNETGKVEALMNTRRWSADGADEHYKTSMQLAIQNLVREYDSYRELNADNRNYIVGLYDFAQSYHPQANERDGFNNLVKSLEILLTSKAIEMFQDNPSFNFEEDNVFVICFSFVSANKKLANTISSFVYTDIMDRGTRNPYREKLLLCIDEFGTLESSTIIKDLLEKGRSGGCQTVFSVLDINQIAMTSGEHFVNAILGTINNFIIHAGATQNTADLLAGVQKYDKGYDIMSLRKPYKGKKPTALLISKYPIINKKNNQEVYRIIPYSKVLKMKPNTRYEEPPEDNNEEEQEEEYRYIPDASLLDLSKPIENIDDYL